MQTPNAKTRKIHEPAPSLDLMEFLVQFKTWPGVVTSLVVLFILIGNWSPLRLTGQVEVAAWHTQPRVWIAALLSILSLRRVRWRKNRSEGDPATARLFRRSARHLALVSIFLLYMMATALWAPDLLLALDKLVDLLLMLVAGILFGIAIARSRSARIQDVFFGTTLLLAGALGGLSVLGFQGGEMTRAAALGGGPNAFGASMTLGAMGALYFATRFSSRLLKNGSLLMFLYFVVLVISSGSRGALVSLLLGTTISMFLKRNTVRFLPWMVFSGVLMVALFSKTGVWEYAQASFERRVIGLVVDQQYLSARDTLFFLSLDMARDHWVLGGGLESFVIETGWNYPHNLFMEALTEGGLVGLILLLLSLGYLAVSAIGNRKNLEPAVIGAAVAMLAFSQFSGDLFDSRRYFLVSILVLVPILQSAAKSCSRHPAGERQP